MILIKPESWYTGLPICLLSGTQVVGPIFMESVLAYQRAGVPLVTMAIEDYIRAIRRFNGDSQAPAHDLPSPLYDGMGL